MAQPLRYLLAALAGAAGVIHLAMVPSHMDEWAAEGVAFAVVGWLQLALALGLVIRPSRALLQVAIGGNVVAVGAWVVTRTAGSPVGPNAGHAEDASLVDLATVGLELALVLLALVLLVRPEPRWAAHRVLSVGTPAVVLLATVVLASPSARNHAGESHGGHGDDETAQGMGHEHAAGETAAPVAADDRGLSELRNGHQHEMVAQEVDAATQAELDEQLAVTREVAAAYPTVADALAAGYRRIGPYFPGIGGNRLVYGGGVADHVGTIDAAGWSRLGSLQSPRDHLAAASDGEGRVWFLAGRQGSLQTNQPGVDLVDGDDVTALGEVPTPRGGVAGFHVPGVGGCVAGGEASATFREVECIDSDGSVAVLPELSQPRHGMAAVVRDGVVYVLLGGPTPGLSFSGSVQILELP